MKEWNQWSGGYRQFLFTLPYSALLYVASVEEDCGNKTKAQLVYDEIKARDAGAVQKPVPEGMGHAGDWRESNYIKNDWSKC